MSIITPNTIMENQSQVPEVPRVNGPQELGQDAFLRLLMAQMQHQDPLNPMENTEFVAQLAQFSSVEQLTKINTQFTGINSALMAQNQFQSIQLVGKQVKAASDSLSVTSGKATPGLFTLEDMAASVRVRISDSEGNTVKLIDLGTKAAGEYNVDWDGTDSYGNTVANGTYHFDIEAADANGNEVATGQMVKGTVSGITFDSSGTPVLLVGSLRLSTTDVVEIISAPAGSE